MHHPGRPVLECTTASTLFLSSSFLSKNAAQQYLCSVLFKVEVTVITVIEEALYCT